MLMDEATGKVVRCGCKSSDLTGKALLLLLKFILERLNSGEQSLKKLNKSNLTLDFIEVSNDDINGLKRSLKRLGVDFSVVKSQNGQDQHYVYFKAKDVNQIQQALEKYVTKTMERLEKGTLRQRLERGASKVAETQSQSKVKNKKQERTR